MFTHEVEFQRELTAAVIAPDELSPRDLRALRTSWLSVSSRSTGRHLGRRRARANEAREGDWALSFAGGSAERLGSGRAVGLLAAKAPNRLPPHPAPQDQGQHNGRRGAA